MNFRWKRWLIRYFREFVFFFFRGGFLLEGASFFDREIDFLKRNHIKLRVIFSATKTPCFLPKCRRCRRRQAFCRRVAVEALSTSTALNFSKISKFFNFEIYLSDLLISTIFDVFDRPKCSKPKMSPRFRLLLWGFGNCLRFCLRFFQK